MTACRRCRLARTVVLALLLGGGAGLAADVLDQPREISMLATFAGALLPVLWWARKNRAQGGGEP